MLAQLKPGGRLVAVVGEEPMMRATFITKPVQAAATDGTVTAQPWDTVAPRLLGFAEDSKFSF